MLPSNITKYLLSYNPRGRLSTKIQVISRRSSSARLNSWKGGRDPGYDQSGQRFHEAEDLFKGNRGLTIAKNFSILSGKNSAEQVKDDENGNINKQIRIGAFSKYVNVAGVECFQCPQLFFLARLWVTFRKDVCPILCAANLVLCSTD